MTLGSAVRSAWKTVKENAVSRRYLQNYPNDALAGNLTRSPYYAVIDNAVLGVGDTEVIGSVVNAFIGSVMGWSIIYSFGNSLVATVGGEFYQEHAKKIDAVYSAGMTFIYGLMVNGAAGYEFKENLMASGARAGLGFFLGPLTRWYTDSFRQMRNEPKIAKDTQFKDTTLSYKLPRFAAMVGLPVAMAAAAIIATPNEKETTVEYMAPTRYEAISDLVQEAPGEMLDL